MSENRIPDFYWEQLALGELDPEMSEKLMSLPEAESRLASLKKDNEAFLNEFPPEWMASALKKKSENSKTLPFKRAFTVLPLVAAAALAFALVLPRESSQVIPPSGEAGIRIKGGTELKIYKASQEDALVLSQGDQVFQGDQLQLSYVSSGEEYGVIFSVDGRGVATLHYPEYGTRSAQLDPGTVDLSYSYILDDAPGFERFYFVFAQDPFDYDDIIKKARNAGMGGEISVPKGLRLQSILLKKGD